MVSKSIWLFAAVVLVVCVVIVILDYCRVFSPTYKVVISERILVFDQNGGEISNQPLPQPLGYFSVKGGYGAPLNVDENGDVYTGIANFLSKRYSNEEKYWNGLIEDGRYCSTFLRCWSNIVYVTGQQSDHLLVLKIDPVGQIDWSVRVTMSDHGNSLRNVAVDAQGNLYVTGGVDEYWKKTGPREGMKVHAYNLYVAKVSINGSVVWTKTIGQEYGDRMGNDVNVDGIGNVIVCGSIENAYGQDTAGGNDCYLIKLDTGGQAVWSRHWGTTEDDVALGLRIDAEGSIFVVSASGTIDTRDNYMRCTPKIYQVTKLDSNGEIIWNTPIRRCPCENSWVCPWQMHLSGDGVVTLLIHDDEGVFLSQVDKNGNKLWVKKISPDPISNIPYLWQEIGGIGMNANGNSYVHFATLKRVKIME